jgi:hypothetical protein
VGFACSVDLCWIVSIVSANDDNPRSSSDHLNARFRTTNDRGSRSKPLRHQLQRVDLLVGNRECVMHLKNLSEIPETQFVSKFVE